MRQTRQGQEELRGEEGVSLSAEVAAGSDTQGRRRGTHGRAAGRRATMRMLEATRNAMLAVRGVRWAPSCGAAALVAAAAAAARGPASQSVSCVTV